MNILAGFEQTPPEETSGIYAFVSEENETVYYIGQSKNIKNRYSGHSVREFLKSKSLPFNFLWKPFALSNLDAEECFYIKKTSPLLNSTLNEHTVNTLKIEYKEFIRKALGKQIQRITVTISLEHKLFLEEFEKKIRAKSNINKVDKVLLNKTILVEKLLKNIELGKEYLNLKQMFLSAPNKDTIFNTDYGTFTGWLDYLDKQGLKRSNIDRYIFMYQHRKEYEEMRLISKDPADLASGAAGHRKIASIKAVKWYLQKIAEEGEHIRGTLTACDYQAEIQSQAKKVKENKYVPREQYEQLKTENELLKLRINSLQARLEKAERSRALQIA
jgi:hypothetical protein